MSQSVAVSEGEHYILAREIPVPERTHVLKQDDTFGVFNEFGDIATHSRHEEGLYHQGTRFLSRLALRLAGLRPLLLSSTVRNDDLLLSADLTNPDIELGNGKMLPRGSLHIYRSKLIWSGACYERIHVRNFTLTPLDIELSLEFAADYSDIFELRGRQRSRRGRLLQPRIGADFVELAYEGLDRVVRRTRIACESAPASISASELRFSAHLDEHSEQVIEVTSTCVADSAHEPAMSYDAAVALAERSLKESERMVCDLVTSHERLNLWIERSRADLNMLLTRTPAGMYPSAGLPWSDTTFGRDGIITALQCLWLSPDIARGVLSYLAQTQSTRHDPHHDAEPGMILHEARRGEMAALGEIPYGRYYGSADSTPLFVMLAGAYWRRSGDLSFVTGIWPNVLAALAWLDEYGDSDGDGFIEYQRRSSNGLLHQGWKDSDDAIFHADGSLATGPIALCEVQAYAYAARLAASELALALGHERLAQELMQKADSLRQKFDAAFWCEEMGLYALALDGNKQPCQVRTSNAGHTLFTGIATPERIGTITRTLSDETIFAGWGVRTLADREIHYNPMAYHNGAIWPHDNALLAMGFAGSPAKELAVRIFTAQLEASAYFESSRMPALFCGFRRREGKSPTRYPVACSPQAWSAGAVFMMLQACLGVSIDAHLGQITFRYPQLPANIEKLAIRGLNVGSASVDLTLYRYSGAVGLNLERRTGKVDVSVLN